MSRSGLSAQPSFWLHVAHGPVRPALLPRAAAITLPGRNMLLNLKAGQEGWATLEKETPEDRTLHLIQGSDQHTLGFSVSGTRNLPFHISPSELSFCLRQQKKPMNTGWGKVGLQLFVWKIIQ